MNRLIIKNGKLINEGKILKSDIEIIDEKITRIEADIKTPDNCKVIDADGMYVIPGVIDDQVHFREPGLTRKGDIAEGSRAAAAGGVTSFMDMPNVIPPTTTNELLHQKQEIASQKSLVNYSFYLGATKNNIEEIKNLDPHTTCGVKVFMGSSTGNMLVDDPVSLSAIFSESPILIATHCEDTPTINANLKLFTEKYGDNIPIEAHPLIRSREACFKSSSYAVELAHKYGSRLHILHLSTKEEIDLLDTCSRKDKHISGEACVHHLWFNDCAYKTMGNLVRWNPAIKTEQDREALVRAVCNGLIDVVATDHAPHLLSEKQGIYVKAAGGGPLVQHSLCLMLQLHSLGQISMEKIVDAMCHAPAEVFGVEDRGFLRVGYKADIAIFKPEEWTVNESNILYKCGWSPINNTKLNYKVKYTIVNGKIAYDNGSLNESCKGQMLTFKH